MFVKRLCCPLGLPRSARNVCEKSCRVAGVRSLILSIILMCSEQCRRGPDTFATRIVSIAKVSDCFLKLPDDGLGGSGVFSRFLMSILKVLNFYEGSSEGCGLSAIFLIFCVFFCARRASSFFW